MIDSFSGLVFFSCVVRVRCLRGMTVRGIMCVCVGGGGGGVIFPLGRILRYVSVVTIASGESAILGWRNLCVGCIGERCCLDGEVVEVVCWGEEWMLGDWYRSGVWGGSLRCVV